MNEIFSATKNNFRSTNNFWKFKTEILPWIIKNRPTVLTQEKIHIFMKNNYLILQISENFWGSPTE